MIDSPRRPDRVRRILVPIRPGGHRRQQLEEAIEPFLVEGMGPATEVTLLAVGDAHQAGRAAAFLSAVQAWFPERQLSVRAVVSDDPVRVIVAEAADHDLVILGAPTDQDLQAGLGPVAGRVLDEARSPTMVVWRHLTRGSPGRILIPTDGSMLSETAIEVALALAEGTGAVVSVVHAVTPDAGDASFKASVEVLERATEMRRSDVALETHLVRTDDAEAAIRRLAAEQGVGLLLLGTQTPSWDTLAEVGGRLSGLISEPPCALALLHVPD